MILITGANCAPARVLLKHLAGTTTLRAVDDPINAHLPEFVECLDGDLRDPAFANAALQHVDAVLHFAALSIDEADPLALDRAARGTYVLMTSALDQGIQRFLIGSSMDLFAQLPAEWRVDEWWRPRPTTRVSDLCAWLAEQSAHEVTRASSARITCLRIGSSEDATLVAAVQAALSQEPPGWRVVHTASHRHVPAAPASLTARPTNTGIKEIAILGAGGPLGAAAAQVLQHDYRLRLIDVRPIAEIAAEGPRRDQPDGAPLPVALGEPHTCRVADIARLDQVIAACAGADAIVNCTVIRRDPVQAFAVNMLGAYHVARSAVALGIRRVVHTGPEQLTVSHEGDYRDDFDIPDDAPPRPGRYLYMHTKFLGQQIMRVFAEQHGLEVPVLLYNQLVDPSVLLPSFRPIPMSITWEDAGRSIRSAIEVPALPSPYELFTICADMPHGKFRNARAKDILGWRSLDNLTRFWSQPDKQQSEEQ